MAKENIRRIINGSDSAVLFIHGILGTPDHFNFLLPSVPDDWSYVNMWLDGHGGSVSDFSNTSMKKWKHQVGDEVESLLSSHKRLVIVAHSMGTLFAIREAVEREISALFLLNTPMTIRPTFRMMKTSWKVFRKDTENDKLAVAAKEAYGIEDDSNILRYIGWIPRYLELFSEISKVRELIPSVKIPTRVYLSNNDEMVSLKSENYFSSNSFIKVRRLAESGHYYYSPDDITLLRNDFKEFINVLKRTHS